MSWSCLFRTPRLPVGPQFRRAKSHRSPNLMYLANVFPLIISSHHDSSFQNVTRNIKVCVRFISSIFLDRKLDPETGKRREIILCRLCYIRNVCGKSNEVVWVHVRTSLGDSQPDPWSVLITCEGYCVNGADSQDNLFCFHQEKLNVCRFPR